jgi:hypothetical protein
MNPRLAITAIATAALAISACVNPAETLDGAPFETSGFGPFRLSADSIPDRITLPPSTKAEPNLRGPAADEPLVLPMVAPAKVPATDQLAKRSPGDPQLDRDY